jgi:hypothetical protein
MNWLSLIPKVYEQVSNLFVWFGKWKKGRYEDAVDKAVDSLDERRVDKLVQSIKAKRNKRQKRS